MSLDEHTPCAEAQIKELNGWKVDLEELAIEKAKAEGRLEQAMSDLKEKGFDSLQEAKVELDRLIKEKETIEKEVEDFLKNLKEKYAEFIE
jgi:hypothetical protein